MMMGRQGRKLFGQNDEVVVVTFWKDDKIEVGQYGKSYLLRCATVRL